MDLEEVARIPVVADGRIKPLDTVARTSLLLISKQESFKDTEGHRQPAIRWLMDVLVGEAHDYKVFRIDDSQVLKVLDLEQRPAPGATRSAKCVRASGKPSPRKSTAP